MWFSPSTTPLYSAWPPGPSSSTASSIKATSQRNSRRLYCYIDNKTLIQEVLTKNVQQWPFGSTTLEDFCAQNVELDIKKKFVLNSFINKVCVWTATFRNLNEQSNRFTYFWSWKMIIFLHIPKCYLLMKLERFSPCSPQTQLCLFLSFITDFSTSAGKSGYFCSFSIRLIAVANSYGPFLTPLFF